MRPRWGDGAGSTWNLLGCDQLMVGRTNIGGELKTFSDTFLDNIMDESDLKHLADSGDFWGCQINDIYICRI